MQVMAYLMQLLRVAAPWTVSIAPFTRDRLIRCSHACESELSVCMRTGEWAGQGHRRWL